MTEAAELVKDAVFLLKNAAGFQETEVVVPDTMVITGGQSANDLWVQYKADITGMKIEVPECADAELMGDAVLAFKGAGLYSSVTEGAEKMCRIRKTFIPQE